MPKQDGKEKELMTRGAERVLYWFFMSMVIMMILGAVYVLATD